MTANPFCALAATYHQDSYHQLVADTLVQHIPTMPSPDHERLTMVDIGTGTGFASQAAARRFGHTLTIHAIDSSPDMITAAKQDWPEHLSNITITWQVADATQLHWPPGSVDLIVCASTLHFLGSAVLTPWRQACSAGGVVAWSAPQRDSFRPTGHFADMTHDDVLPTDATDAAALATAHGLMPKTVQHLPHTDATGRARASYLVVATPQPN